MKITFVMLTLTAVVAGIFFINVKNAWADVENWLSYEITFEGGAITLKVPPNHRFKDSPRQKHVMLNDARPVQQIFSAQYDFGLLKWNDIAHFEVVYTLVRFSKPLPNNTPLMEIKPYVNEMLRRRLGHPSAAEGWQAEIVSLDNGEWIRSCEPSNSFTESFTRRCGTQLALIVSPAYFVDKRNGKNSEWLNARKSLFRKMVSNVRC